MYRFEVPEFWTSAGREVILRMILFTDRTNVRSVGFVELFLHFNYRIDQDRTTGLPKGCSGSATNG